MTLSQRGLKLWCLVHKWTSLVATLFLLLLCLTGLPLIFHEEIDALADDHRAAGEPPAAPVLLVRVMADARHERPSEVPLYLSWDYGGDHPTLYAITAPTIAGPDDALFSQPYDAASGTRLDAPPADKGVMAFLLRLHANLLLGVAGQMLLGFVGLIFLAAVVSGVVVYAPFMRKLAFGTVRRDRSRRLRWFYTHNLSGIVTTAWVSVVALTGFLLAMELPITYLWQRDQLAELTAPWREAVVPAVVVPVDAAVAAARSAAPDTRVSFVAWPGTKFSSRHHYLVALNGTTPLTKRLVRVALVDATNGKLTALRETPWYVTAAFLSAPLHFGDYGDWPMKIIWALLDVATIVVLISGLVLWRRRPSVPTAGIA